MATASKVLSVKDPAELPWKALGRGHRLRVDRKFTKREDTSKHLAAGAKKVIVTAPAKGPDATLVFGVNDAIYDPAKHHIISNASCTTTAWRRSQRCCRTASASSAAG